MGNTTGKYEKNKAAFCEMMEAAKADGRLISLPDADILDIDGKLIFRLSPTGNYLDIKAGKKKSNKRAYVSVPLNGHKFMCPDYWAKIACDYLLHGVGDYNLWRDGVKTWGVLPRSHPSWRKTEVMMGPYTINMVINHINGDSLDCKTSNLEVVSEALNKAHSRLMSEIHYWYPDIVKEVEDCQGNKMHCYSDGVGISCKQIQEWNSKNKDKEIRAFVDKRGEFNSRFSRDIIDDMLKFFNKAIPSG